MRLYSLGIDLLAHFNPADEDFAALKRDAEADWNKIPTDEKGLKENPAWSRIKKVSDHWVSRMLFGYAFIVLKRKIHDYLNPVAKPGKGFSPEQEEMSVSEEFQQYLEFKKSLSENEA